jgi:hypothetical protein
MATVRPEISGRKTGSPTAADDRPSTTGQPTVDRDAYSVPEFCERHNISHGTYYNLRKRGLGPREGHVLGRVIITRESAADWRRDITKPHEITKETAT